MTFREVGTWSKNHGNVLVTIKKQFTYKDRITHRQKDVKYKYLGDEENPVSPMGILQDIQKEFFPGETVRLVPTSTRGGKIVVGNEAKRGRKTTHAKRSSKPKKNTAGFGGIKLRRVF